MIERPHPRATRQAGHEDTGPRGERPESNRASVVSQATLVTERVRSPCESALARGLVERDGRCDAAPRSSRFSVRVALDPGPRFFGASPAGDHRLRVLAARRRMRRAAAETARRFHGRLRGGPGDRDRTCRSGHPKPALHQAAPPGWWGVVMRSQRTGTRTRTTRSRSEGATVGTLSSGARTSNRTTLTGASRQRNHQTCSPCVTSYSCAVQGSNLPLGGEDPGASPEA